MYDIIGNIHGHTSRLEALLQKLGYDHDSHSWRCFKRPVNCLDESIKLSLRRPEKISRKENRHHKAHHPSFENC